MTNLSGLAAVCWRTIAIGSMVVERSITHVNAALFRHTISPVFEVKSCEGAAKVDVDIVELGGPLQQSDSKIPATNT